ncbi:hypothetical protein WR25_11202 [Diploscapter pachys]|uniref:Nematode cuticle collagen N-terminal domain-containing protein n=1 Tax=Diploscapter pachys TaxID=2018661 RepID=A0A2A2LUB6_9BILA|nr:hypothetical protein WR25_11202 [Diploscapter pachys]
MVRLAVYATTTASAFVVVAVILAAILIVNDIEGMREDVMSHINEFKVVSEDTWGQIAVFHGVVNGVSEPVEFASIVGRNKRSAGACNCGLPRRDCPADAKESPDRDLLDCQFQFQKAIQSRASNVQRDHQACQVYRARKGVQGILEFPDQLGRTFFRMIIGSTNNSSFSPGGANGPQGVDGLEGPRGPAGADCSTGRGGPGGPGRCGPVGEPGPPGLDGRPGDCGPKGDSGPPGISGNDGLPGEDGRPAEAGPAGSNGEDAGYCECPQRAAAKARKRRKLRRRA